jgi:hypothetical protein
MRKFFLAILVFLGPLGVAYAAEIGDLSSGTGQVPPDYTNLPLGLPAFIWWAAAVYGVMVGLAFVSHWNVWLKERLSEPSTFVSLAVFVGLTGLFISSLALDPDPMGQGFLLAAAGFAFFGLVGRDREGPLL